MPVDGACSGGSTGGPDETVIGREALSHLLSHVDEALLAIDVDGRITWASPGLRRLLGHAPESVVGLNVGDFLAPDDRADTATALQRWEGRAGAPRGTVHQVRNGDGGWVAVHWDAVTGPAVAPLGEAVVTLRRAEDAVDHSSELRARDVAEARLVRLASLFLRSEHASFEAALDQALEELSGIEWVTRLSLWTIDGGRAHRRAVWAAPFDAPRVELPERFSLGRSSVLRRLVEGEEVHIRSVRHLPDDWSFDREVLAEAGVRSMLGVPLIDRDATLGFVMAEVTLDEIAFDAIALATLRSAAGIFAGALARDAAEQALEYHARTDPLTGLANRYAFDELLAEALRELEEGRVPGVGVGIVDLDRFKLVNDALGHVAGDRLLADAVARLVAGAPEQTVLARLGGDELLVLYRGAATRAEAVERTEAMLRALDRPFEVAGQSFVLTASAGVAHTRSAAVGGVELVRRADVAMYRAKDLGGDRVETEDESARTEVAQRVRREAELREAVAGQGLEVHYQAEWDLRSGRVVGAEALVRWDHPVDGLLTAASFVPLAEECGVITGLGEAVLREACGALASWMGAGLDPCFVLRVNVSAHQLRDRDLVEVVRDVLDDTGVPAANLCLELTESALLADPDRAAAVLGDLRQVGVGLAVDDFGTGYSSMLYLKRLPITGLKVDQAFVAGLPDDAGDLAIVRALVHLAGSLGLAVTAEGVEQEDQRAALLELGCTRAQGFLLARPEPAEAFTARLR